MSRRFAVTAGTLLLCCLALLLLFDASGLIRWTHDPHALALLIRRYGALLVFVMSLLEVIPPFSFISPGILLLVIAGSLAGTPSTLFLFITAAVCGVIIGNMILFRLGYHFGRDIAHRLHLTAGRLHLVEAIMRRFGRFNVFFGQFIGIVRPGVAFVAGASRMPVEKYYPSMLISSVLWGCLYIGMGFILRSNLRWFFPFLLAIGALIYVVGFFVVRAEVRALRTGKASHGS